MKYLLILLSLLTFMGCGKSSDNSKSSPVNGQAENKKEKPVMAPTPAETSSQTKPVQLGKLVNVDVTPEQPLIGLRYSSSQKNQFDFNFKIKPSEFGITEFDYIAHVYLRLVSKKTNLPLTQWYFQNSLDGDKVDPSIAIFFFQPIYSKAEVKTVSSVLKDLAIQISIKSINEPEDGQLFWIDLGGYCEKFPANFLETDSMATGCILPQF